MPSMHLMHTAAIERPTATRDTLQNKVRAFAAHLDGVPCRLIRKTQMGRDSVTGAYMVINRDSLIVEPEVDIAAGDRLSEILYEDGTAEELRFDVRSVIAKRGARGARHKLAVLEQVT